jgi:hypothetical protein
MPVNGCSLEVHSATVLVLATMISTVCDLRLLVSELLVMTT